MDKGTGDIEQRNSTDRRGGTDRREGKEDIIVTEVVLPSGERVYERRTGIDRRFDVDRRRGASVDITR